MFRRKSIITMNTTDDLALQDSYASRTQRWASTMDKIDSSFAKSVESDAKNSNMDLLRRPARTTPFTGEYFSVLAAPGTAASSASLRVGNAAFGSSRRRLREWMQQEKLVGGEDAAAGTKKYFERCVSLLNSLVLKIVITEITDGKAAMEVAVHPKFITCENLEVHQSVNGGESIHLIQSGNTDTASLIDQKYPAMKALGMLAYELLMRGMGPPIQTFLPSTAISSDGTARLLLSLDDYDEKSYKSEDGEQTKRQRASRANKQARISAAMINEGVPYPLCRLVVDLLGGECSDGLLFRSDSSFESFSDIIQDLQQMMQNASAFIHLSVRDQWRLAFGDKMHGRETEKKMLLDAASRVTGTKSNDALFEALALVLPQNKQQIVMVSGQPGCGKSRLVMEAKISLENQGWIFLSCKFDRIIHSEPLSIIAGAFHDFLARCDGTLRQHQIRTHIKALMQPIELSILSKHVPCLSKYADSPPEPANGFEGNREQVHRLFGKLLGALSLSGQAVAFFADDLQWADATSLDLFAYLTTATEPDLSGSSETAAHKKIKVLCIGSYRENELKDNHQLVRILDGLRRPTSSVQMTAISLSGFDSSTLNGIVSESLCLPLRRTKPLTDIILQKTDGIMIHIIELIGRLTMERILRHSFNKGWEWDSEVLEACPISESVAELFTFKLNALSSNELLGLQICSIFGMRIEQRIIDLLQGFDGVDSVNINAGLRAALDIGLVEAHRNSKLLYKFAHDLIAQAVFDLIPTAKRSELLKKLVSALIKNAAAAGEIEAVIFVAVDLINRIPKEEITDQAQRVLYATMNSKAGTKALSVPDFSSAAKYSESSIAFLNSSHWKSHHDLMLSIHETSVLAHYSCSNSNQDLLKERINVVFEHALTIDEEFRTRLVWIKLLSVTALQDAINECHILLERLGEPIDSSDISPSQACSELIRVKESMLGENHQLSSHMTDPTKVKVMKVMLSLFDFYHYQRRYLLVTVCVRMVEMSLKNGCSEESYPALASFAANLIANLGDVDIGVSWARTTLSLMSNSSHNVNLVMPSVITAVYGFVLWWKEPIQSTLDQLLHGCKLAFDYGIISSAMNNAALYITRVFYCGKNLNSVMKEVELFAQKAAMHGQITVVKHCLVPLNNILRKLNGLNQQPLAPMDRLVSNDELLQDLMTNGNAYHTAINSLFMFEITSAFILRDMIRAQRLVSVCRKNVTIKPLVFNCVMLDFYAGLISCYTSRQSRDTSCVSHAEKICEKIKWMKTHSKWNFESKFNLLQAECHFTRGEIDKAAASYEAAIKSASEHKFENELAISYECTAYFYKDQGDDSKAMEMFKLAREAYKKWGAAGKAESLAPFLAIQNPDHL